MKLQLIFLAVWFLHVYDSIISFWCHLPRIPLTLSHSQRTQLVRFLPATDYILISLVAVDASIMWVHIECSASIITACLPTLVPFFTKMKTITTSIGSGWTRFTRSKASTTGRSENSLDLKSFDLSKRNSSTELEADKPNPQIHATTVISVV